MSDGTPYMIKLMITDFKHNTSKKTLKILIERETAMPFLPVQGLINYCQLRGVQPSPLFCYHNLEPITVYQFNTELSRYLTFCGPIVRDRRDIAFSSEKAMTEIAFSPVVPL